MQSYQKVKIRDLNVHIVCSLCAGYYIDATTITECLHTFCRSCIIKFLQSKRCCPQCGSKVHETQPLSGLRSDRVLQDIVYKLIPSLQHEEVKRMNKFEDAHKKAIQEADTDIATNNHYHQPPSHHYQHDPIITFFLTYFRKEDDDDKTLADACTITGKLLRAPERTVCYQIKNLIIHHLLNSSHLHRPIKNHSNQNDLIKNDLENIDLNQNDLIKNDLYKNDLYKNDLVLHDSWNEQESKKVEKQDVSKIIKIDNVTDEHDEEEEDVKHKNDKHDEHKNDKHDEHKNDEHNNDEHDEHKNDEHNNDEHDEHNKDEHKNEEHDEHNNYEHDEHKNDEHNNDEHDEHKYELLSRSPSKHPTSVELFDSSFRSVCDFVTLRQLWLLRMPISGEPLKLHYRLKTNN